MKSIIQISSKKVVLVITLFFLSTFSFGQYCDSITPTMTVDLSASPNMSWVSPLIARDGNCCGTSAPEKCLEFIITLNPAAIAVSFNIASGAVPPGALFYQIDCGPAIAVGSPICLSGAGPHHLTFCKPGNNSNTFSITSYSEPIIGPDITLNSGCIGEIYANYYNEPSMTWTSIFPGAAGAFDAYLNCTAGCDTVQISAPINPPAFIDYLVCGTDIGGCNPLPFCDTVRVTFIQPITVTVSPDQQHLCFGAANTNVTATASGGSAPYSFLWNNGETTASISVGAGTYIVEVTDISGCIIATDTAVITQDLLPIVANAGADQTLCSQSIAAINLNGTIQTATGGSWSGSLGSFAPNNSTLNATYTPTLAEISSGSVTLILTTTGNNGCPAGIDSVKIDFIGFTESITLSTNMISCFGLSDGEAFVSASGLYSPFQYSWDNGPLTTDTFALNLTSGIHQVQLVNSLGCDTTLSFNISQPTLLNGALVDQTDNICNGEANGEAEVSANGGTAPYSYSWNTTPVQDDYIAINLLSANYTCTIVDANGCSTAVGVTIAEPPVLTLALAGVDPNCFGSSNGAISSVVTGGTSPFDYDWSNGPTSSNIYDLTSGWYILVVTDNNNCSVTDSIFLDQPTQITGTISNSSVICPNASVELGVIGSGGTGNYQYEWFPNSQTTDTITEFPIADQIYSCMITDNNGCSVLLSTGVTINTLNPNDLVAMLSASSICELDSVALSAQYTGPDTTVVMSWMHCPACPTNGIIYENPIASTSYVISATNYCGQTIYDTVAIVVNPLPVLALNPVMGTICPGEEVSFVNNGNNSPNWSYSWNFGDGTTSTLMQPIHEYTTSGSYSISLTVTDNNGCSASLFNGSQVIVNPQANALFTSSSTSETTLDPTFELINLSSNANIFQWNFGDGTGSTATNPIHMYNDYGMFTVTLFANNSFNCPDSTFITLEVKPSYELFVPNAFTPDNDDHNQQFFAKGYGISEKDFTFYIFNRWGDLIFESHDMNHGWDGTIKQDGTKAQDDVYTWVVYFRDISDAKHKKEGHVSLLK
jgi:gliding motility-associated-like protein